MMILFNSKKMYSHYFNYSMYSMLIFSTIMIIMSNSWMMMWIFLEINMISFIPLLLNKSFLNKSINGMIKYFIVQAFSSSILFVSIILFSFMNIFIEFNEFNKIYLIMMKSMFIISLLIKMGASPFHWWMPQIMIKLNWNSCLILMTWQKIAPLSMIFQFNLNNFIMINISAILSLLIGSIMGLNQTSIKLIFAFSSINHMGWMLMNLISSMKILIFYFSVYSLMLIISIMLLNKFNLNYLNQIYYINNKYMYSKMFFMMMIFSMGGIPPFIGFLPKMLTLMILMKNFMFFESLILISTTLITLKFYINLIIPSMMIINNNMKSLNKNNYMNSIILMMLFISLLMMFLLIYMINLFL